MFERWQKWTQYNRDTKDLAMMQVYNLRPRLPLPPEPGPVARAHKGRNHKLNPRPSEERPGRQEAHHSISLWDPTRHSFVNLSDRDWKEKKKKFYFPVAQQDFELLTSPVKLAHLYKDSIKQQIDRRVAQFFFQVVCGAGTGKKFEISGTEGQIFCAPTLHITSVENPHLKASIPYQAAHSSTIPTLEVDLKPFLPGSSLDTISQSTIGLPRFANNVDTLVDGKLRKLTLSLINRVAKGELTPEMATVEYLDRFLEQLGECERRSKTMTAEKGMVIQFYIDQIHEIKEQITSLECLSEPSLFDGLFNVNVQGEPPEFVLELRKILYFRKCELIRREQEFESYTQQVINAMLPSKNPEKAHMIRLCLVHNCTNDRDLQRSLEKLFCVSNAEITEGSGLSKVQKEAKRILSADLKQMCASNVDNYNETLTRIREGIHIFREFEQRVKLQLLKDFGSRLHGWDEAQIGKEIRKILERLDHTSRREVQKALDNGKFTKAYAAVAARALGISPRHFDFSHAFSTEE